MSENNAQSFLRRALIASPHDRVDQVENLVMVGMPDTNCCISGREFWVENKEPREPKRSSTRLFGSNHCFSQEQINWSLRQRNAGGTVYGFIWTDKRGILIPGALFEGVNDMTVDEIVEHAHWASTKPVSTTMRGMLRQAVLMHHKRPQ